MPPKNPSETHTSTEKKKQRLTIAVEDVPAVPPAPQHVLRPTAQQLHDLRAMIVVLAEQLSLTLRIEQVLGREQFENDARQAPHVRRRAPVAAPRDGLGRAVLPRLDVFGVVFVDRRRIAEVGDLD